MFKAILFSMWSKAISQGYELWRVYCFKEEATGTKGKIKERQKHQVSLC
jgi:hypothetical protein